MKSQKNKTNIGTISCVTVAAMTCVGLTGCRTQAEDVMEPLKDGKYEEAVEVYDDADWSDKEKDKFKKQIREYLSQLVTDYAAGIITYEQAIDTISTISNMQIHKMDEDVATASGEIATMYASKTAYDNGLKQMDNGNYDIAIEYFKKVIETDCNYETAKSKISESEVLYYSKIKTQMLEEAETFVEAGDYISALNKIDNFMNTNGKDTDIERTYDEYVDAYISVITKQVDDLIANKDYIGAFEVVRIAQEEITLEELVDLKTTIEDEYILMITEKVETLIGSKEYLQAIDILNNAQEIVTSEKFTELMATIEAEKPVYLSDLKYQSSNQFELINDGENVIDTLGNIYTPNSNLYEMTNSHDGWSEYKGNVDYYLGYSYNKMCFKLAVDDVSTDISSVMTIYGDDIVLYTINLDRKTIPTEIVLDVSNVNYLSMNMEGAEDGSVTAIISEGYFE